ncbi:TrmH family RNA methyltransferase [Streptomyces sp. F63]|uniref:TrmH family RNA methyltransferase n=1 Tax=Streptomyces sp. F63 TaxID=2824887 RepID=UPI0035AF9139
MSSENPREAVPPAAPDEPAGRPGRDSGPEAGPGPGPGTEPVQYDEDYTPGTVGVGPHPRPWPTGDRWDPGLLAHGDRRNVVDRYRYWTREAIVADLDTRRHAFHIAVENWTHDFNIGSVVRTANAFLAQEVHIVGRRRWNRRGAMVTDRYQHVRHHPDTADLTAWAEAEGLPVIGIDNLPGSVPLETTVLPRRCVLLFGQEGPGLTAEARKHAAMVCSIAQFGSTRSINAGAAAAIAMHAWVQTHVFG